MEITEIQATAHRIDANPIVPGPTHEMAFAIVRIETSAGITGIGEAGFFPAKTLASHINEYLSDTLIGENPLQMERIREICIPDQRVPPGLQSAVVSMLDIALWDIRGKVMSEPVWKLLGGTDPEVDVYVTLGSHAGDTEEVVTAAEEVVQEWSSRLKMLVAHEDTATAEKDATRVKAVREAIGSTPHLALDANTGSGIHQAIDLCNRVEDCNIAWFEEPVYTNDLSSLASLRNRTTIPVAAGQFSGHRSQHWELLNAGAIDICQPNVCYVGGYTEGSKVTGLAEAANSTIVHAGGWPFQNMHLVAAATNAWLLEVHSISWAIGERIYNNTPSIVDGSITLSQDPGVGLEPDWSELQATKIS